MKQIFLLVFLMSVGGLRAQAPRLVVPVGHTEYIPSVAFSPDGKYIVTGSTDETVKLWDLNGHELLTFKGLGGFVRVVAFSPDGKMILAQGDNGWIGLWDLNGNIMQSFHSDFPFANGSVFFSSKGKNISILSSDTSNQSRILNGVELRKFIANGDEVSGATLSSDGNLVLLSGNECKLQNSQGRLIHQFSGQEIRAVAFSPDGQTVLTAGEIFSSDGQGKLMTGESYEARLWDLKGNEIRVYPDQGVIHALAFSPDGKTFLAGYENGGVALWDVQKGFIKTLHRGQVDAWHASSVSTIQFSPNGKAILIGWEDRIMQILDPDGNLIYDFSGSGMIPRVFSPDGNTILATTESSDKHAIYLLDLKARVIQAFSGHGHKVRHVEFSSDGKSITTVSYERVTKRWDLTRGGIENLAAYSAEFESVGYALTSDKRSFLVGGSSATDVTNGVQIQQYVTTLRDFYGRVIKMFPGHMAGVPTVAFSPDEKQALTGSWDNTAKIWDIQTGKELATLIAIDSTDWIVTTPSGLFDASPGAMKLMYYVIGLEAIDLEQLKERYYEPGLLAKVMGFDQGELRNVAAFDQVALYPEIKATVTNHQLQIQLTERNGGLGKLSFFLNGKEVLEDLNPRRLKNLNVDLKNFAKYYKADTVVTLALRAYNTEGWLKSQAYELAYKPATSPAGKTTPRFYAVVVGTSNYAGDRLDLRFADLDAEAIAKAFQSTAGALFGADHTSVQLLSTSAAAEVSSKNNIRRAFAHIAEKSTPADVLVVYFSGHGVSYGDAEKAQFYYLTKDIGSEDLSDPEIRSKYAISSDTLTKWLTDIPAKKQVMILDACNAGKVLESLAALDKKELDPSQIRAFDRMKDRTGMFILTGSAADKVSYEATQYGQGLLTYSLLQGMSGLALKEGRYVDVMTLFQYSRDKVPELAKGIGGVQTPVLAFPASGASFDIGIVNAGVNIPVAEVKPVFIRNNFQNEETFNDDLKLTQALADYLAGITVRGTRAELIYVDVSEYANAWSVKGRYTVAGNAVQLKGRLFRGETMVREFEVAGRKDALRELVEKIVAEVVGK